MIKLEYGVIKLSGLGLGDGQRKEISWRRIMEGKEGKRVDQVPEMTQLSKGNQRQRVEELRERKLIKDQAREEKEHNEMNERERELKMMIARQRGRVRSSRKERGEE